MAPRWQAAWWPKRSRGGAISGSEHGSTLTSSVVAGIREVISATVATHLLCLHPGTKLRIASGPLKGLQGTCVERRAAGLVLIRVGFGLYVEVAEAYLEVVCNE